MSKRAEELAISIADVFACVGTTFDIKEATLGAAALIDAELRKERERCAERMTAAYDGHGTIRNHKAMKAAVLKGDE